MAFGISGFLVQLLTAPIAIAIDALSFVVSALLLGSIRHHEEPPPLKADREPVLDEIREGLRLVIHDPVLRAFAGAQMALHALWGIFGATWFLFVLDELRLGPAVLGVVAGVGGFSSFVGAIVAARATRRWGIGPVAIMAMLLAAVGNAFIPLAPASLPLLADRLPRHAAARRGFRGHRLRHHRAVREADAGARSRPRAGELHVPRGRDARPAARHPRGRAAGRGRSGCVP